MSEGVIPAWDQSDRMRKALKHARIAVGDMADYLGVQPSTVSTWINGKHRANHQTMRLWSIRTGVDLDWLEGVEPGVTSVRHQGLEPRTRCLTTTARSDDDLAAAA
jgi:transcriptional regulator with XRE-family HTH domain